MEQKIGSGSVGASNPAAPGLILSVPKICLLNHNVAEIIDGKEQRFHNVDRTLLKLLNSAAKRIIIKKIYGRLRTAKGLIQLT